MIDARRIITVGVDCSKLMGGVSAVEIEYSRIYNPWRHVATSTTGSSIKKLCYFITGLIKFLYMMIAHPNIEIVHIHGASYYSFWRKRTIVNIAKIFNKKVIFHCHGAEFKLFTSSHRDAVLKMLHKCDRVVCLSESWKQWFEQECGCENVVIIKNIISEPQLLDVLSNDGNCLKMLFLGELGKRKGIYDLLDVIAELKEYDIQLYCGGNGDVDGVLKRVKDLKIEDKFKYLGWVGGDSKIDLLNKCDVFVLPSYNEGLPISVLEAMSYGMPIVSTKVGGIPEIVLNDENGFLIEPGDKKGLCDALLKLKDNESLRSSMGEKSKMLSLPHQPIYVEKQLQQMYNSI
jgi:glycosyltransferase involved in cell wall biosynthesis